MDAPGPSRTPVTERITLYCTWWPSALTTRPREQVGLAGHCHENFSTMYARIKYYSCEADDHYMMMIEDSI